VASINKNQNKYVKHFSWITATLGHLIPFFGYDSEIPTTESSQQSFREFNSLLKGENAERVLKGVDVRTWMDPDCVFPDRQLTNFNNLQLLLHPKD
jgi:hypothetical protein